MPRESLALPFGKVRMLVNASKKDDVPYHPDVQRAVDLENRLSSSIGPLPTNTLAETVQTCMRAFDRLFMERIQTYPDAQRQFVDTSAPICVETNDSEREFKIIYSPNQLVSIHWVFKYPTMHQGYDIKISNDETGGHVSASSNTTTFTQVREKIYETRTTTTAPENTTIALQIAFQLMELLATNYDAGTSIPPSLPKFTRSYIRQALNNPYTEDDGVKSQKEQREHDSLMFVLYTLLAKWQKRAERDEKFRAKWGSLGEEEQAEYAYNVLGRINRFMSKGGFGYIGFELEESREIIQQNALFWVSLLGAFNYFPGHKIDKELYVDPEIQTNPAELIRQLWELRCLQILGIAPEHPGPHITLAGVDISPLHMELTEFTAILYASGEKTELLPPDDDEFEDIMEDPQAEGYFFTETRRKSSDWAGDKICIPGYTRRRFSELVGDWATGAEVRNHVLPTIGWLASLGKTAKNYEAARTALLAYQKTPETRTLQESELAKVWEIMHKSFLKLIRETKIPYPPYRDRIITFKKSPIETINLYLEMYHEDPTRYDLFLARIIACSYKFPGFRERAEEILSEFKNKVQQLTAPTAV